MSAIMFDRFISPVEAVATSVAVPVRSTYLLRAFYWADDITAITAPHYTQACISAHITSKLCCLTSQNNQPPIIQTSKKQLLKQVQV